MHRRFVTHPTSIDLLREDQHELVSRLPRFTPNSDEAHSAAMFLGPRAENADLLKEYVNRAIDEVSKYRRGYLPGDPKAITDQVRATPEYQQAVAKMGDEFDDLLQKLTLHATPYFAMRYQGHMLWDTLLPGIIGYFATMLHNPNNVTVQASTLTTFLELLVGWDLCTMLGYRFSPQEPWGHITADGSVANLEATWASRELKLWPVAVKAAVEQAQNDVQNRTAKDDLTQKLAAHAAQFTVTTSRRGTQPLLEAPTWELLNLTMTNSLDIQPEMSALMDLDDHGSADLYTRLLSFAPNTLGLYTFYRRYMRDVQETPIVIGPSTKHYSWPKAGGVLGMGSDGASNIDILVDANARMDIDDLRLQLDKLVALRRPVALTVAVAGSTEEGAMDPIGDVLEVREEFRQKGLEFNVHADAAWGGYFMSTIRADFAEPGEGCEAPFIADQSHVHLNAHTRAAFERVRDTDSCTIDPHKMGYIQYPAGALCYADTRMRNLVTFGAPVIGSPGSQVSVGEFGIEGSKPGAAPAAVYLAHQVLRPSTSGYGQLINEALRSTKALYLRIATLADESDPFVCVPLVGLPSERDGIGTDHDWMRIIDRLAGMAMDDIVADPQLLADLNELGPDQNIVDYTFNVRRADGSINTDLSVCQDLNQRIYDAFHVHEGRVEGHKIEYGEDIQQYPMIITQTQMSDDDYSPEFINFQLERLGITNADTPSRTIKVNRTVVMDPWLTHAASNDELFLDIVVRLLRDEAAKAANAITSG